MNEKSDFPLVPRSPTPVERAEPGSKRILAVIVADMLALAPVEDPEALFQKGYSYCDRDGVPSTEAVKWLRKAAERGHATAQYILVAVYLQGEVVPRDFGEAVKWGRMAAQQGHAKSQFFLGGAYANGEGVPKDSVEAMKWYCMAAEQGDAEAQYQLGQCHDYGQGVAQNCSEAVKWYRTAAEQGHAKAEECVGAYLYVGRGVEPDYVEAVKWMRKTLARADDSTLLWLGECYAEGKGIARDFCEAYKFYKFVSQKQWFLKRPETGVQQLLDSLVKHMTSAEEVEGERRYREFKAARTVSDRHD